MGARGGDLLKLCKNSNEHRAGIVPVLWRAGSSNEKAVGSGGSSWPSLYRNLIPLSFFWWDCSVFYARCSNIYINNLITGCFPEFQYSDCSYQHRLSGLCESQFHSPGWNPITDIASSIYLNQAAPILRNIFLYLILIYLSFFLINVFII